MKATQFVPAAHQDIMDSSDGSIGQGDLLCFSHLRWNFVTQRPQHLMKRFAKERRVFYFEEPRFDSSTEVPALECHLTPEGVQVVTPVLPESALQESVELLLLPLVNELVAKFDLKDVTLWYYTPMALPFSMHLEPQAIVYDCMDELSLFRGAPTQLLYLERELLTTAHLVLTGGHSLYEAKQHLHPNIHPIPSSIDFEHFVTARHQKRGEHEPLDQQQIPHPRVGFYGVIDERFDVELLAEVAVARRDLQFVIIGPVVKIDPTTLPRLSNIHYLGQKNYNELPGYMRGWDVAMIPFCRNDSTRFISPTKTPEYLAAGLPVVSTSIRDVVRPYGEMGIVEIADEPMDFAIALDRAMQITKTDPAWRNRVDQLLASQSWDRTFNQVRRLEKESPSTKGKSHPYTRRLKDSPHESVRSN